MDIPISDRISIAETNLAKETDAAVRIALQVVLTDLKKKQQQQDSKVSGEKRKLPPPPAPKSQSSGEKRAKLPPSVPSAPKPQSSQSAISLAPLTKADVQEAQDIIESNCKPLSTATSSIQNAHAKLAADPGASSGLAGFYAALNLCRIATALEMGTNGGPKLSKTSAVIVKLRCDEWDLNIAAAAAGSKDAATNLWYMAYYNLGQPRWGESQDKAIAKWEARKNELSKK